MAVRPEQNGTVRVGSFELFERIGRGGMGVVYRALHLPSSTPSAVKVITAESARTPTLASILHREVQTTAMLTHPAIIEIYDYGVIEDARRIWQHLDTTP
ncbi:MAG: protein kinase domain-containing protein [Persicimonas sp.]